MLDLASIQSYIEENLDCHHISITDDAHLHQSHQRFQSEKAYLTIRISLKQPLPRLQIHRRIMALAKKACPIEIHALQVIIT